MIVFYRFIIWITEVTDFFRMLLGLIAMCTPFLLIGLGYIHIESTILFILFCIVGSILPTYLFVMFQLKVYDIEQKVNNKIDDYELKKRQNQKLNINSNQKSIFKIKPFLSKEIFLGLINRKTNKYNSSALRNEQIKKEYQLRNIDTNLNNLSPHKQNSIEQNSQNYIIADSFKKAEKESNDFQEVLSENIKDNNKNHKNNIESSSSVIENKFLSKEENEYEKNSELVKELNEIFIENEYLEELVSSQSKEYNRFFPKKNADDLLDNYIRNQSTGMKGELFVLDYERNELIKNKRPDLALKVEHVSLIDDSLGYDILSFDANGNKKHIEVKSTISSYKSNFFLTENEMNTIEKTENYFIYRVFNVNDDFVNKQLYIINCDFDLTKYFTIQPSQYKVTPRKKQNK